MAMSVVNCWLYGCFSAVDEEMAKIAKRPKNVDLNEWNDYNAVSHNSSRSVSMLKVIIL